MRRSSGLRHLLEWKSSSKRRRLKRKKVLSRTDERRVQDMIPGGAR